MVALTRNHRRSSLIGVDVGASGVRTAQLRRDGDLWTLCSVAQAGIKSGQDALSGEAEDVSSALARCLQQSQFGGNGACVGVNPPDVEFHALELPSAVLEGGGESAEQVVANEVSRLMTFRDGLVETRYWQLPPTNAAAPNAVGVAAPRSAIDRLMGLCEDAGLSCQRIDASAAALSRFGAMLRPRTEGEIWGILDLGERQARLVVSLDTTPILVRVVGEGGRRWSEIIAESLNISQEASEIHKRDHGLSLAVRNRSADSASESCSELSTIILGILRAELNKLATEVKRSYEYVLGCYPSCRASDLILAGGGAAMRNVGDLMGQALGIEVHGAGFYMEKGEGSLRSEYSSRVPVESVAVAAGLALGVQG